MAFYTSTQATTQIAQTVPNLTGGTNGKVVRISASNTCVDATNLNTVSQLNAVLIKMGNVYYSSGLVDGFTGLVPGTSYFLSTGGDITSTPPVPSGSVRSLFIGYAVNSTALVFKPMIPITG